MIGYKNSLIYDPWNVETERRKRFNAILEVAVALSNKFQLENDSFLDLRPLSRDIRRIFFRKTMKNLLNVPPTFVIIR